MTEKSISFPYTIRQATDEDLDACAALDHSSTTDYVWQVDVEEAQEITTYSFRTVRLPRAMTVAYPQDSVAMRADWRRREFFLVVEDQGKVCAYLNMRVDRACGIGWIRQLVVDRSRRRKRIGSTLLRVAERWARDNHLHRLMIETQTKNFPAIAFCQRNGFVLSGFNDRYYPNQDIAIFFFHNVR